MKRCCLYLVYSSLSIVLLYLSILMTLIVILLLLGCLLLAKGADYFVDGAIAVARRCNLSDIFIGLTIVAFGTSLPELFVNIQSAYHGYTQLALGNILGSNIANIGLVLTSGILLGKIVIKKSVTVNIYLSLFCILTLGGLMLVDWYKSGSMSLWVYSGLLLLTGFVGYFIYSYRSTDNEDVHIETPTNMSLPIVILMIVGGLAATVRWADLVVNNAILLAKHFGVSEKIIWLTVVAIGTSLPELITTIVSVRKWFSDVAVWNVIGSNIFNILLILSLTMIVHPIYPAANVYYDVAMVIILTLLLLLYATFTTKIIQKRQGVILLALYIGYVLFLIR